MGAGGGGGGRNESRNYLVLVRNARLVRSSNRQYSLVWLVVPKKIVFFCFVFFCYKTIQHYS